MQNGNSLKFLRLLVLNSKNASSGKTYTCFHFIVIEKGNLSFGVGKCSDSDIGSDSDSNSFSYAYCKASMRLQFD